MSDEDKTKTSAATEPVKPDAVPSPDAPPEGGISTALPTDTNDPAAPQTTAGAPQAEPLSDGTVPTVLGKGSGVPSGVVAKGRSSIASVYQRADVVTTAITFGVAILAAAIVLGGYIFLTRSKTSGKPVAAPKVTTLSQEELSKLGTFFGGSGGGSSEVLTISSSTLFKGRVAIASDLKTTGGIETTGSTTLGDLTVNKIATLGPTTVRGALNVAGPLNLQSPAVLGAGTTIKGDVSATGNGSFGGSLSAGVINTSNLAVTGNLTIGGHLVVTGARPGVSAASDSGSGATAGLDGNDSAGTVTIETGNVSNATKTVGGALVTVTFKTPYGRVPRIIISPIGARSGGLRYYVEKTASGFTISATSSGTTVGATSNITSNTGYAFDYWVVQ